jgi:hypothetical protein
VFPTPQPVLLVTMWMNVIDTGSPALTVFKRSSGARSPNGVKGWMGIGWEVLFRGLGIDVGRVPTVLVSSGS